VWLQTSGFDKAPGKMINTELTFYRRTPGPIPWAPQEKTWNATKDYNTEYNMHARKSIHNHIPQQYQDDRKRTVLKAAILSGSVSYRGTHSSKRLNDLSVAEPRSRRERSSGIHSYLNRFPFPLPPRRSPGSVQYPWPKSGTE
jgi:hypothetical protein